MTRTRFLRTTHLLPGLILALTAAHVGCGDDGASGPDGGGATDASVARDAGSTDADRPDAGPPEPIPDEYFARASEPPDGARIVDPAELARMFASGELSPINIRILREQEAEAAVREMEDERVIAAAEADNPGVVSMPTAPPAGSVRPYGRDYLHTITLADGRTTDVVTMGLRWQKRLVAEALTVFPRRQNQLTTYQMLYDGLSPSWRAALSLIDPALIEANPSRYPTEMIAALNESIAARSGEIADRAPAPPPPPPGPSSCSAEVGAGSGSDASGNQPTNPACASRAGGVFANYSWPTRPFLTCVRDQAIRGSCTAFASGSAVETAVARRHGVWANLSEQAYYNRALFVWVPGAPRHYGDGSWPFHGFTLMTVEGWLFPFEEQWEYNPSRSRVDFVEACQAACVGPGAASCEFACTLDPQNYRYAASCQSYPDTCSDTAHQGEFVCAMVGAWFECGTQVPDKNPTSLGYRISGAVEIFNVANVVHSVSLLRLLLSFGSSVVVGHPVTPSFDVPSPDGYVLYPGAGESNKGGHSLHAVGFISNATLSSILPSAPAGAGGGYIIVKNSWSSCWGDAGYVYVPYQSVQDHTRSIVVLKGVL